MKNWFSKNYKTIIVLAFLIPIMTVALVSISHVTKWYGISNPLSWAVYLSIGIEIAALSALAAISANMGKKVYFPFGIVTLIQFIGNIYFAYSFIDINSESFKSWVELVSPLVEFMGVDPNDYVGHKRFLSFFAGGMLPIISLSFLHMLVKFTQEEKKVILEESEKKIEQETPVVDSKDIVGEVSRVRLSENDLDVLEKILSNQPKPTEDLNNSIKEENIVQESEQIEQSAVSVESQSSPEPVIEVVPEPIVEVISEPIIEVAPEPIVETVPEPIVEVIPEPVVETIPEPVIEVVPEPIVEVIPETIEIAPEPVVETIPEPIIEQPTIQEEIVNNDTENGERLDVEFVSNETTEPQVNNEIVTENSDDEKKK